MTFFEQFNRFLQEAWPEVCRREDDNRDGLYLYRVGNYWVAFEKSAYRTCECFPALDSSCFSLAATPYPVLFVCLPQEKLSQLPYPCTAAGRPDCRAFALQPLSVSRYRQWRDRELGELA